jgi:DUF177 domain-containing protein
MDLAALRLRPGEGRRIELDVDVDDISFGGQSYGLAPRTVHVILDISRMSGEGHAMRLRTTAQLRGPCMRCLDDAALPVEVDSREVDQPGGGDELSSPYVHDDDLDVAAWARDAIVLALPQQVLCRPDCLGLCAICGENLNTAGPDHAHEPARDPRWDKLSELRFD